MKPEQIILRDLDNSAFRYVNAHISNISFPSSIEELETFIYTHGMYNIEESLTGENNIWTVPRSSKLGDIVLFYHAKTAISRITALVTKVRNLPENSGHDIALLHSWLERARSLYKQYGGKLFAFGRIISYPEYWTDETGQEVYHWRGRIYAEVGSITILRHPVDLNQFNHFITISRQSAITPLPASEFNNLRSLIHKYNPNLPAFYLRCQIGDFSLSHLNQSNFLQATQAYRHRFLLEVDFRSYYVDFLLRAIAHRNYYRECLCHSAGQPNSYVDNVFLFHGCFYLLEVKLNIHCERDLPSQLRQYINADYIQLGKHSITNVTDFERHFMYVIDTNAFYQYDAMSGSLKELISLDEVKSTDDIKELLPL